MSSCEIDVMWLKGFPALFVCVFESSYPRCRKRSLYCVSCASSLKGLTFLGHADLKALLQPAVLAAVACDLVNLTVLVSVAGVHHVLLDTAAEETLEHQEARDKRREGSRER